MKTTALFAPLVMATSLQAGTSIPALSPAPSTPWIVPTLDARLRYEFADVEGFDASHALTLRIRPGLKTREWAGFSGFIEGELTGAAIRDYNGGAIGAEPFDPFNSTIVDPQTAEFNQAYLQYKGFDSIVKFGRQRIIYDNAAFIGNSGWRQNEQTFDAISLSYQSHFGLTFNYAWLDQVNRVFGSEADGIASNAPCDTHLFNASYTGIENLTLGGYVYLMDFKDIGTTGWNNDTYGLSADTKLQEIKLHGEAAFQQNAGPLNDRDALYFHVNATHSLGSGLLTAGIEHLDEGFQTPLATLHAMNGFADATDLLRALGTHGGLTDMYLSHSTPLPWGLKWTNLAHAFGDNELGTSIGFGFDSLLVKKFNEHFSSTAMLGYFDSSDARYLDTTRFSLQLDYSF